MVPASPLLIGWCHDHRQSGRPGGAQLSSEAMAGAAPDWAEVVMCYPGEMVEADCYVLNSVRLFSFSELWEAALKPYVVYQHDLWEVIYKWQHGAVKPIIEQAEAVVFLSPLHRAAFCAVHGVKPRHTFTVPSPIDADAFGPAGEKEGTVWIGDFVPHKGVKEAISWAATNGPVDFYGSGRLSLAGENVQLHGRLRYEEVPSILAAAETFLFLPSQPEPFGRIVAEAYLSGCELVCNERVGALSWGWETRDEWVEALAEAPGRFWAIMQDVCLDGEGRAA